MKSVRKLFDKDPETGNIRHCCSVAVAWKEFPPVICIPGTPSKDPTVTTGVTRKFVLRQVKGTSAKVYVEEGCDCAWMLDAWPLQAQGEPHCYDCEIS